MKLGYLGVMGLIAVGLVSLEVALEYRAHLRGWESPLFGPGRVLFSLSPSDAERDSLPMGPTEGFPFRSPILQRTPPDGELLIWFASASHAADHFVPVRELFPNRMGEILTRIGVPAQVLNASRPGLTIADNSKDLREWGPHWRPDYAFLYGMGGDINLLSDRLLSQAGGPPTPGQPPAQAQNGGGVVSGPFLVLNEWYENTTLYAQLKGNITSLITLERILADNLPSEASVMFRERVQDFLDAAEEVGATPVLVTFSTSHSLDSAAELPTGARQYFARYNPFLSPEGWLKCVAELNEVFHEVARERGAILLDLGGRVTDETHLFRDPVHFTPAGHEEVASFLATEFSGIMGSNQGGTEP